MALKLLAVGDLHLGRRPGGLPDDLRQAEAARAHGPAEALRRLVERAIAAQVDVVALAGDLVEDEHDFFEAYRDLHAAVDRLVRAGIRVTGVAGNHDVQVLPRLADEIEGFHLLGRDGHWEQTQLVGADGTEAVLHGWSFPDSRVETSPLAGRDFPRDHRLHLGLLHCDRDQPGSHHGPVTRRELESAGLDAWLLGHIHKPDVLTPENPSGYLGSVTALRRTETGARGPWLYRLGGTAIEAVEQWTLAPLRWELLEVDLTGMEEAGEVTTRLMRAARERTESIAEPPDALGLVVRFTGRTDLRQEAEQLLQRERLDHIPLAGIRCLVHRWHFETLPETDPQRLAEERTPAGLLAQRLVLLDEPEDHPGRRELLERARRRLSRVATDKAWQQLDPAEPDDAAVEHWLRQALTTALDELQAQRREAE